jgi:ferric-dicitrate binding protein FerR (iron transport regulator)
MCLVVNTSENMTDGIFKKILDNTASNAEKLNFYKQLEKDPSLREIFYSYKNLHTVSNLDASKYLTLQDESFERFWSRVNQINSSRLVRLWFRYAAVFVVALSLGFMIRYLMPVSKEASGLVQQFEYTSEKGSVSTIHLEDGSAIWLSSASKIVLHKNTAGAMTVQLKGEAYFDLVPDPMRNLTIDLGYFKVRDIGTKFNIRSYSAEKGVYTTLVDGQIDLVNNENKSLLSMKQGEYMQYDKETGQLAVSLRDPTIATAWKDGKFVFIDKSLVEICHELENWYNVEIIIRDKALANSRYTSVIKRTTTVNMVLKMLSLTDKINYKITDRKEARDIVYIY